MHDDRSLVEARIRRELMERVLPHLYPWTTPFRVEAWHAPGEPVSYEEAMDQTFVPLTVGDQWSRPWGTTWFRFHADVPAERVGPQLEAVVDLGFHPDAAGFQSEGLVWAMVTGPDGADVVTPLQGVHPRRQGVPLPTQPAGSLTLVVEAASNPSFPGYRPSPLGDPATAGDRPLYRLRNAHLAERDDEVFHLLLDLEVLTDMMTSLPSTDPRRARVLRTVERSLDVWASEAPATRAVAAREVLAPALAVPARSSAHRIVGVGHAHIDTAWLWPSRETVRKCTRTFASAVRLMEDYPEYRFACSQAVQYAWMEERHPDLFRRISEQVEAGRFVPVGGMWVEADMNLPSGESILRQMSHGQRWFASRFGRRCTEVWIPDVFGYPASLPQLFAAGGMHRFVTQKLSWNKQNRFPHHTFRWEGLDGTSVLTHFPPVDTYNATVVPHETMFAERNFREHGWSDWSLMPFGHGNGGGGPTREMLERARRMADLDGVPPVSLATPSEFFDRVEAEIDAGAPVPVWRGELYFEMHRGTLTSQVRTKVGNRRCERLFREAELWWATATGRLPKEVADELDGLWKDVLVQQFHDIIPGSSIAWVHDDAEAVHARAADRLESLVAEAIGAVTAPGPVVANATTHERTEVIEVDAALMPDQADDAPIQRLADGRIACVVRVPGHGLAELRPVPLTDPLHDPVVTTEHSMCNGRVCVQWDLDGRITSIIDVRHGRELLPAGRTVSFDLAVDQPVEYDAWDVESWTHRAAVPLGASSPGAARTRGTTVELVERGPLLARLRVSTTFGVEVGSSLTAVWTVRAGSAMVELDLDVDWHEHEHLLSLMVPLDVRADDAACGIQFGHVRRPTHPSSPWDAAKFEVCAHRFVDLAEPSFGVAVLDDGRYGHGLFDGGIRVSLLRGARYPDPEADQGRHLTRLAILPHGAGLHDVLRGAEALDVPLRVASGGSAGACPPPLVSVDRDGVEITAVKRPDGEHEPGELIVRLYEACGARTEVGVRLPTAVASAWRCDALETPQTATDVTDGMVALTLRPFEVVTLRLSSVRS